MHDSTISADLPPVESAPGHHYWQLRNGIWSRIDDPIADVTDGDVATTLCGLGYADADCYAGGGLTMWVQMAERSTEMTERWICVVSLSLGSGTVETVYCATLPDVLQVLASVGPLILAGRMQQAWEERRNREWQQRKGGTRR